MLNDAIAMYQPFLRNGSAMQTIQGPEPGLGGTLKETLDLLAGSDSEDDALGVVGQQPSEPRPVLAHEAIMQSALGAQKRDEASPCELGTRLRGPA